MRCVRESYHAFGGHRGRFLTGLGGILDHFIIWTTIVTRCIVNQAVHEECDVSACRAYNFGDEASAYSFNIMYEFRLSSRDYPGKRGFQRLARKERPPVRGLASNRALDSLRQALSRDRPLHPEYAESSRTQKHVRRCARHGWILEVLKAVALDHKLLFKRFYSPNESTMREQAGPGNDRRSNCHESRSARLSRRRN